MKYFCDLNEAARRLKEGKVVAFPTETVYGLGAPIFNPAAIEKIFQVKGRAFDNPLIVHISSLNQLPLIVSDIPKSFYLLAEAFFPGPLTVILPKNERVPNIASANLPTIGVRMPEHPLARQLIELVGEPIAAPSANLSGHPSSTTAEHVAQDFGGKIGGILDGGPCNYGIESTVIALLPKPMILRPGSILQHQIENILGYEIPYAPHTVERPASPGMKYRHYAPKAQLLLFFSEIELREYLKSQPDTKRSVLREIKPANLYALLRKADEEMMEEILILCDPLMQKDVALMNRLSKASQ